MRPRPFRYTRAARAIVFAAAALTVGAFDADAQYFGRNKVQYRTFDFRVLETEHFDVYYYPEEEAAAREGARMAERWYDRFSGLLDHQFEERQPLIFYASHPHFQQTTTSGSTIPEGTGGFTEPFKQRVVMPFAYSLEETDHIVGHELVHAFQYDISGLGRAGGGLDAAAQRFQVPLWFTEGMAEYLSIGPVDPHTAMWIRDAALRGDLPSIERMSYDPRIFPYRWGQALWSYIGGRWGDVAVGQILKLAGQGIGYPDAFQRILNITEEELTQDWHTAIRRAYLPMLADRPEAREIAKPLITRQRGGGSVNIGPVLSPDGSKLAFLSELESLDIELWVADAETGEVLRRLQKGAAFDPHFGSLRYINSAGTWSPDSRRFAFSALRSGRDVIVIVDVERGRRLTEIAVDGVDEIMNPDWSPDGRRIAFTGLSGGVPDLYLLDVESEAVEQLTDDPYTELHPAWSPDGRSIAFSTERGTVTDLARLEYGPYRLAVLDVGGGEIALVPDREGWKNINPAWSRDGRSLFFLSNREGIPNVYRVEVASGAVAQVTNIFSGVSGYTDISPAISASRTSDRLLFTAYEDNGYNIYSISDARDLAGTPIGEEQLASGEGAVVPEPAVLPPVPRPTERAFNRIAAYLADADEGLPSGSVAAAWETVDYNPRLGLDYIGQPQVGATMGGPFGGAGLYGAVAGIFSDVLGRHVVYGAVQAQGQLDEIGGIFQYVNTRERWNYGGAAARIPFVYGRILQGYDPQEGLVKRQLVRARIFDTSLQGFTQYPLSEVKRFEAGGGFRRITTDQQIYEAAFDPQTGAFVRDRLFGVDGIALNLFETSAALVYDNALFGYTSPFAGQRYRLQISPTFGELQFTQALLDYRKYLWMQPFTLAVRGLHNGRYGRDAEPQQDGRRIFQDMYLGYPWYIRGYYDVYSDCRVAGGDLNDRDCIILGQLEGSRLAVASAELRFPLLRQVVVGNAIGFPPIEGYVFTDAGIAWGKGDSPRFDRLDRGASVSIDPATGSLTSSDRYILTSGGVGARINVFGYMIVEVNYVNAFERDNGWHWQFNFQPGF